MTHTILGAGGSIGTALAYELLTARDHVRLVSRRAHPIAGAESITADLASPGETARAVKGSDVVYLCAGLTYDTKVWSDLWPKVMRNSIDACKSAGAALIFFDNVYMYGRVDGKMTEETPCNPCSKKGEIRAEIARMLEEEIKRKNISAIIARSADLYGPYATTTSVAYIMALDNLLRGKPARWLIDASKPHSFTYTIDCARALLQLARRNECFGQVWHLPTAAPPIDGRTFIAIAARETGSSPEYTVLKKWMMHMAGVFNKTVRESIEMLYQSEFAYEFDSSKFNAFFNYTPVSYAEGIRATIEHLKRSARA